MTRRARLVVLPGAVVVLAAAVSSRAQQPVTFARVVAERRPHPREIAAESLLAEAAAAAAGRGSFLLDGLTASLSAGPRSPEQGETERDVSAELELPLLTARRGRLDLAARLNAAGEAARRGGHAIALADLARAFAQAWLAREEIGIREQDLAITERWLAVTERRIEAGADPPFEAILVAGERDRALLELLASRRQVEIAWGELASRSDVGARSQPLDLASLPAGREGADELRSDASNPALAGIDAARELQILLARARSAAASSRWALESDVGREGDERIARVGLAYRFPLGRERLAIGASRRAVEEAATAEAASESGIVRARLASSRAALASSPPAVDGDDHRRAREALDSRLAEGKERASQVLPLRRQLLEAAIASAAARAARAQAAAEIFFLEGGDLP